MLLFSLLKGLSVDYNKNFTTFYSRRSFLIILMSRVTINGTEAGGKKGKRFKYKILKNLFISYAHVYSVRKIKESKTFLQFSLVFF
jgi:hypothetical protein